MVKEARFSIPPHDLSRGNVDRGEEAYVDWDELVGDDDLPPMRRRRRRRKKELPINKQPDRRHLAGADWLADAGFADEESPEMSG